MIFKVRQIRPEKSVWEKVEAASPEEAAQTYHFDRHAVCGYRHRFTRNGTLEEVRFILAEVEGTGIMISRIFWTGIFRRGGVQVKSEAQRLRDIARNLGWDGHPEELLADGWGGEEEWG